MGIGRGICLVLAVQGAAVTVADLNEEGAQSVAAEVSERGGEAIAVVVDVTDKASVAEMTKQVMERIGRVDITVNDAGVIGAPSWWQREKPSDDDWDAVMAVNLRGGVNVSESVAESMKERRYGKIVNIASVSARKGSLIISSYSASKAAVVSWTQSHALQLAPFDVNVNGHLPRTALDPDAGPAGAPQGPDRLHALHEGSHGSRALRDGGRVLDPDEERADARGRRQAGRLPGLR